MAQRAEIWQCPACSSRLDVTELGFYAEVTCSNCGHKDYVHTLLANFRLEGVLGIGGMSIVLRGRDVVLNRPVAIKLLNETYRNQPERIARFENECSMMAKVRHENVVSVYSAGWAKDQFYIAMELLEGRNLETIVAQSKPLTPLRAIEIITRVVKGLEAAHIAGMLHRDMKPGNVIITENGTPKVLDFGLAQGRTAEDESEEVIWATPFYVAPETLQRNAEDARTDIYSVGMTLRFLLTGVDALPGNPASVSALLDAKYHLAPFAQEMPKIDECVCDLIDHMTAFAPEERHDNYADLLAELKEVHDALTEKHSAAISPRKRMIRLRNKLFIGAGVLSAAALAYVAGYYIATPAPVRVPLTEMFAVEELAEKTDASAVIQALSKERWKQAIKHAHTLSKTPCEPTMAAWGLLHGACAAFLHGADNTEVDALLAGFRDALAKKHHNPAGESIRRQLQVADIALETPAAIAEISDRRVLGMLHCLLVRRYLAENKSDAAIKSLTAAKEELRLTNTPPYSTALLNLMDNSEQVNAAKFASASFNEALTCMSQHQFDEAGRRLSECLAATPANTDEIQVLIEVCECGAVLQDTLKRLMGDAYVTGIPAELFSQLCEGKNFVDPVRRQEFCALLYLIQNNYAAAFKADPHADKPDSNEPFAVMMRDWKARLAAYIKE